MVKVSEIMKKDVITVGPRTTMDKIAKVMTNNRIGSVVVVDKGKPVRIITTDNIVTSVARGHDLKRKRVMDLDKKKTFTTVTSETNVLELAKIMVSKGYKRMPVVDKGKLVGIVTDKEMLSATPELIKILSEKLKMRVERAGKLEGEISGVCERCESYSDKLRNVNGEWICEECR